MKTINSQQEEYKAFLRNIRREREESSNFAKIIFTEFSSELKALTTILQVSINIKVIIELLIPNFIAFSDFFLAPK